VATASGAGGGAAALATARVAVRCLAGLLVALPHFNYASDLLQVLLRWAHVPCRPHHCSLPAVLLRGLGLGLASDLLQVLLRWAHVPCRPHRCSLPAVLLRGLGLGLALDLLQVLLGSCAFSRQPLSCCYMLRVQCKTVPAFGNGATERCRNKLNAHALVFTTPYASHFHLSPVSGTHWLGRPARRARRSCRGWRTATRRSRAPPPAPCASCWRPMRPRAAWRGTRCARRPARPRLRLAWPAAAP